MGNQGVEDRRKIAHLMPSTTQLAWGSRLPTYFWRCRRILQERRMLTRPGSPQTDSRRVHNDTVRGVPWPGIYGLAHPIGATSPHHGQVPRETDQQAIQLDQGFVPSAEGAHRFEPSRWAISWGADARGRRSPQILRKQIG